MSLQLELNCLVLDGKPGNIFQVEINGDKSVSTLRELIKEKKKHALQHVDADALEIFRVSFPIDDDLDDKLSTLKELQLEHNPEKGIHRLSNLNSVKRLKGVFVEPMDEHLHVIVKPPPAGERQSLWLASITHCGIVAQFYPIRYPS
jgi:Crinkler effector protein N-terminal domain